MKNQSINQSGLILTYCGGRSSTPVRGAFYEPVALESTEPRLSQRWSCRWGCGGTLGLPTLVVEAASRDRTEDYQQPRVLKPPNVRSACVEIRASPSVH